MPNEKQVYIETLCDYLHWVDQLNYEKCLFRGLPNKDHAIEASAWRRLTNEQDSNNIDKLIELNKGLIDDARHDGYNIKDNRMLSDLEILAELQHFRASTFLIDFTYSALVALWFACEERYKEPQESKKLADGKVTVVYVKDDIIEKVTPELLENDIDFFFETSAKGRKPFYWWEPGKLNRRIPPQHSVFVFGVDKVIEPDSKCFVKAKDKQKILDSIERFSHTTETIIFPDFDGFIRQRTQERPYIPEGYESIRAAGYRAYRWEEYEKAISYFDKVIELKPEENDVYYMRGQSKQSLKRNAEAIDDYNKAIELKDNDMNYYQSRGMAWARLNEYEKAKEDLEKALELAEQDDTTFLDESIPYFLRVIVSQLEKNDQWTSDMFKELVPEHIKEHYDTKMEDEDLYKLGAELQSLIQEKEWKLERRFNRSYFVFCYGRKRVFGVNLFGSPRLAIWGTEEDESKFSELNHKPTYYDRHNQWVFPRETQVEDIRDVLEFFYNETQNLQQFTFFDENE